MHGLCFSKKQSEREPTRGSGFPESRSIGSAKTGYGFRIDMPKNCSGRRFISLTIRIPGRHESLQSLSACMHISNTFLSRLARELNQQLADGSC